MTTLDQQLLISLVEKYGAETLLLEGFSINDKKMKVVKLILAGIISGALLNSIMSSNYFTPQEKVKIENQLNKEQKNNLELKKLNPEDTIPNFNEKVKAVEDYMIKAVENSKFSAHAVELNPKTIVIDAAKYNFDIPLALAQAHQESCFGVTPRARKTGSVFSVGLWDNGHNKHTYDDQNESVASYMELVNNDYLQNGEKTVDDLLKPGGFVNHNGDRYASDSRYESKIRYLRNKILRDYPVLKQDVKKTNNSETDSDYTVKPNEYVKYWKIFQDEDNNLNKLS